MDLMLRLSILHDAGQLSATNHQAILKIIDFFRTNWGIELNEENGSMLITHLAIAFERIAKGETVAAVESFVLDELKSQPCFDKSETTLTAMAELLGQEIPVNEQGYIHIHLCTLFSEEG